MCACYLQVVACGVVWCGECGVDYRIKKQERIAHPLNAPSPALLFVRLPFSRRRRRRLSGNCNRADSGGIHELCVCVWHFPNCNRINYAARSVLRARRASKT